MEEKKIMCAVLQNFGTVVYEDLGTAWRRPMMIDVGPGKQPGQFIAAFQPLLRFSKQETCAPLGGNAVIVTYEIDNSIAAMYLQKSEEVFSQIKAAHSGLVEPSVQDIQRVIRESR